MTPLNINGCPKLQYRCTLATRIPAPLSLSKRELLRTVADPERFDADPDPTFHADADPDPTFHADADPICS